MIETKATNGCYYFNGSIIGNRQTDLEFVRFIWGNLWGLQRRCLPGSQDTKLSSTLRIPKEALFNKK